MAEKRDGAEALLRKLAVALAVKLADEVERLPDPTCEDTPAAERIKLIPLAAKAGREIAGVTLGAERVLRTLETLREANADTDAEDNADMNDVEPQDIEQVYADLQSRLDSLTSMLERKRAAELGERPAKEVDVGGVGR